MLKKKQFENIVGNRQNVACLPSPKQFFISFFLVILIELFASDFNFNQITNLMFGLELLNHQSCPEILYQN